MTASTASIISQLERLRTPRMRSALWDGNGFLVVDFDRAMDQSRTHAIFRLIAANYNRYYDWDVHVGWLSDRVLITPEEFSFHPLVKPGRPYLLYMGGDLRAVGRYLVTVGHRLDRLEIL